MRECIGHAPAFVATRVGEVPCPEEAGWSSPGVCGGASCEYVEVDLRPNPRPAGQAASRASRPRIAASPPPKAILSPLSPTTPSARAEKWGGLRAELAISHGWQIYNMEIIKCCKLVCYLFVQRVGH